MMVSKRQSFNDRRDRPMNDNEAGRAGTKTRPGATSPLSPQAERALAEAAARRAEYEKKEAGLPHEIGGRGGKEPVRYGDWEVKGMATDF
jgi:hypothetical protein